MRTRSLLCLGTFLLLSLPCPAQTSRLYFPEADIPHLNVPHMAQPPVIDGTISPGEWKDAARVMGVCSPLSENYFDRPISFWIAWDEQHLYIAARTDILPGTHLIKSRRERYTSDVVYDDAFEFGIFLNDRNQLPNETSSFLKIVLNSLGAGEYMKIYPSIGQNIYNWRPDAKIANGLHEEGGRKWWEMEMALDLKDLQLPGPNKAGDKSGLLLAADLKNPGWQWLDFPSASGHLEPYGFPRTVFTDDQPYVQVESLSGLHDEKIDLAATLYNPSKSDVTVKASLKLTYNAPASAKAPPKDIIDDEQTLTIPAGGSVPYAVNKAFPGLAYDTRITKFGDGTDIKVPQNFTNLHFRIVKAGAAPDAPPIYNYACQFGGTDKSYLNAKPQTEKMEAAVRFNPATDKVELSGDTLDAQIPAGTTPAALGYAVTLDGREVAGGKITQQINYIYSDIIDLPKARAGLYKVKLALLDAAGKTLVARDDLSFEKKDEAKVFAKWWNNDLGNTHKVLEPFEALKVRQTGDGTEIDCTRRQYAIDGLGLPRQIVSNGGNVLTGPARIVVTLGGREIVVPTGDKLDITSRQDWRIEFEGQSQTDTLGFSVKGWMEQDGLVSLDLTFAPLHEPVKIDALRVEWPVDDSLGNWMQCIGGIGGNYGPRTIGKVPDGDGKVWDTLAIGRAGSKMITGNWYNNVWVGNDQRGLCWFGDSDKGWVPSDDLPAHELDRSGGTLTLRNNIIAPEPGGAPFLLEAPRTVNLQYNATPFRHFAHGWRLTQVTAAGAFGDNTFKYNEKEKRRYFSVLSMPSKDVSEWPYYYAKYKKTADEQAKKGWYTNTVRLQQFLANGIALRGYMNKTLEPGLYDYFSADWVTTMDGESLNKSYRDYMTYLMDRDITEGGIAHYYFDISFTRSTASLISGMGYRLADGRVQPGSMDGPLREWYKRVWALMQEHDLYPGGVSGHATNSIPLRALPWTDAILDSEYPMRDPITVYGKDRMIAMSCPENFGVNICHLAFNDWHWISMFDAGAGASGGVFNTPEFRHFGITADDVAFLPFWRNQAQLKPADPGLLASAWKRPGKMMVEVLNYGLDPDGEEKTRAGDVALDFKALGLPVHPQPGQVRVEEVVLFDGHPERHNSIFNWYQNLPDHSRFKGDKDPKIRPPASPTIDLATGTLHGGDIFYHDARYYLVTWDEEARPALQEFSAADAPAALSWGVNRPETAKLSADEVAAQVANLNPALTIEAWRQPGTAMLLLRNSSAAPVKADLTLDLAKLGVKVSGLWKDYTQCLGGTLDEPSGKVTATVPANGSRLVFVDTY